MRHLAEKIGEQPEQQSEAEKSVEFSIPSWMVSEGSDLTIIIIQQYLQVLNGLEQLGYKVCLYPPLVVIILFIICIMLQVVSSSQYVTGEDSFDQKEFVWTLYKNKEDWGSS